MNPHGFGPQFDATSPTPPIIMRNGSSVHSHHAASRLRLSPPPSAKTT
jgi:hypothetical protein